jgi:hypothetical protein
VNLCDRSISAAPPQDVLRPSLEEYGYALDDDFDCRTFQQPVGGGGGGGDGGGGGGGVRGDRPKRSNAGAKRAGGDSRGRGADGDTARAGETKHQQRSGTSLSTRQQAASGSKGGRGNATSGVHRANRKHEASATSASAAGRGDGDGSSPHATAANRSSDASKITAKMTAGKSAAKTSATLTSTGTGPGGMREIAGAVAAPAADSRVGGAHAKRHQKAHSGGAAQAAARNSK